MSKVADELREDSRERLRRMTPGERLSEAMLPRLPADARRLWLVLRAEKE